MQAGKLRAFITYQSPTPAEDEYGHAAPPAWTDVVSVWAELSAVESIEVDRAKQSGTETKYTVKHRYTDLIAGNHRITWRGRLFYVSGISDPDLRSREILVTCHERTP